MKLAELFDGINGIYRSICDMQNRLQKLMGMSEMSGGGNEERGEGQESHMSK